MASTHPLRLKLECWWVHATSITIGTGVATLLVAAEVEHLPVIETDSGRGLAPRKASWLIVHFDMRLLRPTERINTQRAPAQSSDVLEVQRIAGVALSTTAVADEDEVTFAESADISVTQ